MKRVILILSIVACVYGCTTASQTFTSNGEDGSAQTNGVPQDFKSVATYFDGARIINLIDGSGTKNWTLTISADGKARWKVEEDLKRPISLPQDDLREIITSIKESDFFTLPGRHMPSTDVCLTFDIPSLILEVTMDGKSHKIIIDAPGNGDCGASDVAVIQRFGLVWSTVLEKFPSPNNNIELKGFMK